MPSIRSELEKARKDLLDLSLNNTLLNFRALKARGLEIVDELPDQVYRFLVTEERAMSFLPAPDRLTEDEALEGDDLFVALAEELAREDEDGVEGESSGPANRHTDSRLQTRHSRARLEKRLLNTFHAARSTIEEQGINTLYLALGMLHWYEDDSSDIDRSAPLIFVPVRLDRSDVRARFRLRYTRDEIGSNLSLQAKLRQDFGIELPDLLPQQSAGRAHSSLDASYLKPSSYFREVAHAVRIQSRWHVDETAIALGFFSFSKFLMFQDLDATSWPEDAQPEEHEILQALLEDGFREPSIAPEDDSNLDEHLSPEEILQIRDADSSQTLGILDTHAGKNLVIQGPPGTGKSQTITNLIAESIARDRTVLFVAKKITALEVVKRRLDEDGIGDACLELHSHNANNKAFLDELERTLSLGKPLDQREGKLLEVLTAARDELNEYCAAVKEPIGETGMNPFTCFGLLARVQRVLRDVDLPPEEGLLPPTLTVDEVSARKSDLENLQRLVSKVRPLAEHPFYGTTIKHRLPKDTKAIGDAAKTTVDLLERLSQAVEKLAERLGFETPPTISGAHDLLAASEAILNAPPLGAVPVDAEVWRTQGQEIRKLVEFGRRRRELRSVYGKVLIPEAWEQDVVQLRRTLLDDGDKWWRYVLPKYHRAARELRTLCWDAVPKTPEHRLTVVEAILESKRVEARIQQRSDLGSHAFGPDWCGVDSQWGHLRRVVTWRLSVEEARRAGQLPAGFFDAARGNVSGTDTGESVSASASRRSESSRIDCAVLGGERRTLQEALAAAERNIIDLFDKVSVPVWSTQQVERDSARGQAGPGDDAVDSELGSQEIGALRARIQAWADNPERIHEMVPVNHLAERLAEHGFSRWVDVATTWEHATEHLVDYFEYLRLSDLVDRAFAERPILAAFSRSTHEECLRSFRELDRRMLKANRTAVALAHWRRLPARSSSGQMSVLLHEFNKKKRHLPIRQVLERAGTAVQRIKPVVMMSPMSVATYLPPGSVQFDIVIFDEASQIRPVEAFGALLRAGQAVVVGDTKQLPPTSFFDKFLEAGEDEETAVTTDMGSVLGLFVAQGAPERMLRWHYRSRHDSLIQVSNREFYDGKLMIFPSPDLEQARLGVKFHHLPATYYEPGEGRRINRGEARAIADAVIQHARKAPQFTLGVAAFNQPQAQRILDHVELLRRQDPSLEAFFNAQEDEPFFVKTLENVQGDARDVIFISVGYGKTKTGFLSHNFGPLNKEGGERWLNVLITRARRRCELFTNMKAADIDLSMTNARGVVAFKRYLNFAESGVLDLPQETGESADSLFEVDVADVIRGFGHDVHHQIGSAGIDLAIVDPEQPRRYLLGIECDGATYHSARWARDRDRLRQEVLEGLGWTIHRIWSTDWFQNREQEVKRLAEAIEAAKFELRIDTDLDADQLRQTLEQWEPWHHEVVFSNGVRTSAMATREPFNPRPLWKLKTLEQVLPRTVLRKKSALDIGCNCGYNAIYLAQRHGMKVTAIDVFDNSLKPAEFLCSQARELDIEIIKASAEHFERPGAFDLVLHFGTLYHLPNPLLSIERSYNNLREGGYLGLETQCHLSDDPSICKFIHGAYGDRTNYFVLSKQAIERILKTYGFTEVQLVRETPIAAESAARVIYVARKGAHPHPLLRATLVDPS